MTHDPILLFLFVYLAARLFFLDTRFVVNGDSRHRRVLGRILFGLTGFLLLENVFEAVLLFLLHTLAVTADSFITPRQMRRRLQLYGAQWVLVFLLAHICYSLIDMEAFTVFNPLMFVLVPLRLHVDLLEYLFHPERVAMILAAGGGFIFTIKESTIIIRLVLKQLSAVPRKDEKSGQTDRREFERGRLIGILERGLIYFLVIAGQVGAIAILIALKSLARFKELENKQFAEYFLIGSLLSIVTAVVPAVLVVLFL